MNIKGGGEGEMGSSGPRRKKVSRQKKHKLEQEKSS